MRKKREVGGNQVNVGSHSSQQDPLLFAFPPFLKENLICVGPAPSCLL